MVKTAMMPTLFDSMLCASNQFCRVPLPMPSPPLRGRPTEDQSVDLSRFGLQSQVTDELREFDGIVIKNGKMVTMFLP